MSYLSRWVDRNTLDVAAGTSTIQYTSLAHSLPTTPEMVVPTLKSVAVATGVPGILALRGNASLNTVGWIFASNAGVSVTPAFGIDVYSIAFMSLVR